jgi:hypothetical protein
MDRTVGNPAAKAAVDMATWDALGRTLGLPVTGLLGGYTDRLRVSHMVGFAPDAEMVAEAERVRDRYGIRTFKVKVGRRPVDLDVGACRALRAALGPDVELYVDDTGRLVHLRARVTDALSGEPATQDFWLAGTIEADGVRWPRSLRLTQNGVPYFELEIKSLRVLPRVEDAVLAGPR